MDILRTGVFTATYHQGFIRHISYGETEIIRMIYFALRDHNWGTIPYRITGEQVHVGENFFTVRYRCHHFQEGKDIIVWDCEITGNERGEVGFSIAGAMLENFQRNRAGFCVLHPVTDTVGAPVEIIHPDGKKTGGLFPINIDPVNPFRNIRSLRWKVDGQWYRIDTAGDVFETEDQRNWGDASFKTFCTPSDEPFPVQLNTGDQIRQKVTFTPERRISPKPSPSRHIELEDTGQRMRIPFIGIGASTEFSGLSSQHIGLLAELDLHHYRIDVSPSKQDWVAMFSRHYTEAHGLGLPLEVVLHLTEDHEHETEAFLQLCLQNRVRLYKVLFLSAGKDVTDETIIQSLPKYRSTLPLVLFGAGTDYNFTEVNRNRFAHAGFDFISYSIHPQEHASDDLTLIENLQAQGETVRSAKSIYGHAKVIHLSPVTLRRRFNPYATSPGDKVKTNEERSDPRQLTAFCSAWTFGSICALAEAETDSVTCFQTVGKQGIISRDGDPYPVYETLRRLSGADGHAEKVSSNKPLEVQAMRLPKSNEIAMVNFTNEKREVWYRKTMFTLLPHEVRFDRSDSAQ